jgi:hypothetical protein
MTEIYYQDTNWSVPELVGQKCISLFGLTYDNSDTHPEMLFFEFNDGRWHRCYIDPHIGFWDETKLDYLDDIISGDYEGSRKVDYLKLYGLYDKPIKKVWCQRDSNSTFISVEFSTGIIEFREFDDENKDSEILFISSE